MIVEALARHMDARKELRLARLIALGLKVLTHVCVEGPPVCHPVAGCFNVLPSVPAKESRCIVTDV